MIPYSVGALFALNLAGDGECSGGQFGLTCLLIEPTQLKVDGPVIIAGCAERRLLNGARLRADGSAEVEFQL